MKFVFSPIKQLSSLLFFRKSLNIYFNFMATLFEYEMVEIVPKILGASPYTHTCICTLAPYFYYLLLFLEIWAQEII